MKMYKKIKNSSFMNIFWFILYLLPLVMIIVFSINFYRNDDINVNENPISYHIKNNIRSITFNESSNVIYNYDLNYYTFTEYNSDGFIIYYDTISEYVDDGFIYLSIIEQNFSGTYGGVSVRYDNRYIYNWGSNDFGLNTYMIFDFPGSSVLQFDYEGDEGSILYVLLTDAPFEAKLLYDNYYNSSIPVNNVEFDLILNGTPIYDYATYLQDNFYNTFSQTGIIYNMFINLFSYFGVLNIYIKIISVYLEYIILISLIHLAVDILLLLPNICHKFMERIGGERD